MKLDFWFEFGSPYSYLSAMRLPALAQQAGISLHWRPFLLGPIFQQQGWNTSPFILYPAKGAYMWQDMARQAAKYGLPFHRPSNFPRRAVLPSRIALANKDAPWIAEFVQGVMQLNFVHDREIDDDAAMLEVLSGISRSIRAEDLIRQAQSEALKPQLRQQTEAARSKGIFGAPSFLVAGEMFWGNDRLEDALALAQAFATRGEAA